tara:strand:- start:15436 stop:15633 length:198 start_codon:yes stop_codon:yes gene_type:complete
MKKYNSVFTIAFEAQHDKQDASDLTYADLRNALQERLDRLDNTNPEVLQSPLEIFGEPEDTNPNQ